MLQAVTASDPAGSYVDWGVIHISVTNLLIILVMLLVFVLAIVLPFPGAGGEGRAQEARVRREDREGDR